MSWQLHSLEALASTPTVDVAKAEQGSLELSQFSDRSPNRLPRAIDEQPVWPGLQTFS